MSNQVRIHESRSRSEAQLVCAFLQSEGVEAEVRGGEPPGTPAQVWVPKDVESVALELLEQVAAASESSLHIVCPRCTEANPAHFERCWKCQTKVIGTPPSRRGAPKP